MQKAASVTDYKLLSSFERLRARLLQEFAEKDILDKPLAFWALPNDRRLPLVFMGRSLRDLLNTPFDELYATPGVGQKKINSLLILLQRAAHGTPPEEPLTPLATGEGDLRTVLPDVDLENINPLEVSEQTWAEWRDCVVRTGFDHLPLGRFAPSLRRLPRVIWYTPLSTYTGLTLAEIRNLKTHGDKRVAAVIEVFGTLYRILGPLELQPDLAVQIVPRIVSELSGWVQTVYDRRHSVPPADEIYRRFVHPLLVQIRVDGGPGIENLAQRRLGLSGYEPSVKRTAEELGLTRARVYQLLADIAEMVTVRWPEGKREVTALRQELHAREHSTDLRQFDLAVDLFFPTKDIELEGHDN